jgi:hypothetical protein
VARPLLQRVKKMSLNFKLVLFAALLLAIKTSHGPSLGPAPPTNTKHVTAESERLKRASPPLIGSTDSADQQTVISNDKVR